MAKYKKGLKVEHGVSNTVEFKIWPFSTNLQASDLFLTFIIFLWDQDKAVKELQSMCVYVCVCCF